MQLRESKVRYWPVLTTWADISKILTPLQKPGNKLQFRLNAHDSRNIFGR